MQSNEEIQGNLAPFSRERNLESGIMNENARSAFEEGRSSGGMDLVSLRHMRKLQKS
jgi:hypothetical protein